MTEFNHITLSKYARHLLALLSVLSVVVVICSSILPVAKGLSKESTKQSSVLSPRVKFIVNTGSIDKTIGSDRRREKFTGGLLYNTNMTVHDWVAYVLIVLAAVSVTAFCILYVWVVYCGESAQLYANYQIISHATPEAQTPTSVRVDPVDHPIENNAAPSNSYGSIGNGNTLISSNANNMVPPFRPKRPSYPHQQPRDSNSTNKFSRSQSTSTSDFNPDVRASDHENPRFMNSLPTLPGPPVV